MHKIRLLTRDGKLVGYAEIPWFKPPPDVLLWGERVFTVSSVSPAQGDPHDFTYVEAFMFAIVTPVTPTCPTE